MLWTVEFDDVFAEEFSELDEDVKVELAAMIILLGRFGPQLGRPHVDTLKGSKHANMKELRFKAAGGVWRVAFAFDQLAAQSCSSPEINQECPSGVSTAICYERRIN
ncbi:MAG TPA: type II toxin-antitoxin system RelE/ParE family toxin [Aestuariivirgaceae bacterium]|nr:type II toxin-antitoxin system RelE/ParE family toxin [Aestuariivirgaceae bacterium]